jgi:citrate lyase subunit beta/citryl-CoA lyase
MTFSLIRSALFLPRSNPRAIEKARSLDTDAIIFDLEDAVADHMKISAREQVRTEIERGGYDGKKLIVRVNSLGTSWIDDDIEAISSVADAILLPKVECASDIREVRSRIPRKVTSGPSIWAMIETARGILKVREIAAEAAAERLSALVVGPNDIERTTHTTPGEERRNFLPWLLEILVSGRSYDLLVLDGVFSRLDDEEGFLAECRQGHELGFDGKTLIHPKQIAGANQAFTPTVKQIEWARKVVAAFETLANGGPVNVINLDGEMVERLHLVIARRVLDALRRAET